MTETRDEKWQQENLKRLEAKFVRPKRKKINAIQRKQLKAAAVQLFVKQYARKAQKRTEPNDRKYSRDLEKALKAMNPLELSALIADEGEE
jgi:hypothetical protein